MRFIQYFIICFGILFAPYTFANSTELASILSKVQTMSADFVQTVTDGRGKSVEKSYGRMALQRPGKFRWEVTKPIPQTIIANQPRLWIYDPDLQQVTIRAIDKETGQTPAILLSDAHPALEKNFVIKAIDKKNTPDWQWFSLLPKKKDTIFSSIELGFKNNQINQMRLQDNLGHTTLIVFKNIRANSNLSASLFNFKPGANVDVINETK